MWTIENLTAIGVAIALITFIGTVVLYWRDKRQQRAAQTREDLQAIIGVCGRFLHPLSEDAPYPILHTASAITKEFSPLLGKSPKGKAVFALLRNKDLLLSICVEGWISSTQIGRMMDFVDELESKAYSHNLRGRLLLICQASFLLGGIVSEVCSPETFYKMFSQLDPHSCQDTEAQVILNIITVELQHSICKMFNDNYKELIKQCLYFIQIASSTLITLEDRKLVSLAKAQEIHNHYTIQAVPDKKIVNPISELEKETSLSNRVKQVQQVLTALEKDINKEDYHTLCNLVGAIKKSPIVREKVQ